MSEQYKLVPVEPTDEMLCAAFNAVSDLFTDDALTAYKAMIAAAQPRQSQIIWRESLETLILNYGTACIDNDGSKTWDEIKTHLNEIELAEHPFPAESDKEAVRNAALEEYMKRLRNGLSGLLEFTRESVDQAITDARLSFRGMKSQPAQPSDMEILQWIFSQTKTDNGKTARENIAAAMRASEQS